MENRKQMIFRLEKDKARDLKIYTAKNDTSHQKLIYDFIHSLLKENKANE